MVTRLEIITLPSQLEYDHGEILEGGAQFFRLESLEALKNIWLAVREVSPFACVGTGFGEPHPFLGHHEWIFSPTPEALVSAVVRWDEFKISPRWFDIMSDERSTQEKMRARRATRRDQFIMLGRWSPSDERAYQENSSRAIDARRRGFWRLSNLPCGLSHFDWFSEHATVPDDPNMPRSSVDHAMRLLTYHDWAVNRPQPDVELLDADGVDREIAYWERERLEGRDPYEDSVHQ